METPLNSEEQGLMIDIMGKRIVMVRKEYNIHDGSSFLLGLEGGRVVRFSGGITGQSAHISECTNPHDTENDTRFQVSL